MHKYLASKKAVALLARNRSSWDLAKIHNSTKRNPGNMTAKKEETKRSFGSRRR